MDAAQSSAITADRVVALDNAGVQSVLLEFAFTEKTRKEAAVIATLFQFDGERAPDWRLSEFHVSCLPDQPSWVKIFSEIFAPMASAAVAAGEGALTTCRMPRPSSK